MYYIIILDHFIQLIRKEEGGSPGQPVRGKYLFCAFSSCQSTIQVGTHK